MLESVSCGCDKIPEVIRLRGRTAYFHLGFPGFESMLSGPHCLQQHHLYRDSLWKRPVYLVADVEKRQEGARVPVFSDFAIIYHSWEGSFVHLDLRGTFQIQTIAGSVNLCGR